MPDVCSGSGQILPASPGVSRRNLLVSALAAGGLLVMGTPGAARAQAPFVPRAVPGDGDIFVDPRRGDDDRDGSRPVPGPRGMGPVATLVRATEIVHEKAAQSPARIQVWLRGGTYRLTEEWVITPFADDVPVTFSAFPGERPVIDGSMPLGGWKMAKVDGRTAWRTTVPDVDGEPWDFTQLFVNGARRPRPRLPKAVNAVLEEGQPATDKDNQFYAFQDGTLNEDGFARTFVYRDGDIDPTWHNLTDVDVVAMRQWFDERSPLESVDPVAKTATVKFRSYSTKPWPERTYYVENVREALTEPGEWYLDRTTKEVIYLPRPGEVLPDTTITAPRVRTALRLQGTASAPVRNVRIEGITFTHTAWDYWIRPDWNTGQSAVNTIGTIEATHAVGCVIDGCTLTTIGEFGIALNEGCTDNTIAGNTISDMGSGGIKSYSFTNKPGLTETSNGRNTIEDNTIHHGGRVFHLAAGILAGDVFETKIHHNHVHDMFYTGISLGWLWGFSLRADVRDNEVWGNYIHDLGKNLLSDMAGIYTLGRQPGTSVRRNYIHHITGYAHPTSGLYADQGSSFIQWTDNVVHDSGSGFVVPNEAAGNVVENNIFVDNYLFGAGGGRVETLGLAPYTARFHRNVIASDGKPAFNGGEAFNPEQSVLQSHGNLLWNYAGELGDIRVPGSTEALVKLVRTDDESDVPGASTFVDLTSVEPASFAFADLPAPVTLEPNTGYMLVIEVGPEGPFWHNPSPIETTEDASVVGPVYRSNADGSYRRDPGVGTFGPVNLRYRDSAGEVRELVTSVDLTGSLRRDYRGFVGLSFTTADAPLEVVSLGRYRVGSSWWDMWRGSRAAGAEPPFSAADPYYLEAEQTTTIVAPMRKISDPTASGGVAIGTLLGAPGGEVRWRVAIAEAGTYWIWARVKSTADDAGTSDSFFVSVNSAAEGGLEEIAWNWDGATTGTWEWRQVTNVSTAVAIPLEAGEWDVRFRSREAGAWVDAIALTRSTDFLDSDVTIADPKFTDRNTADYTLLPTSPAFQAPVGFAPIDMSTVGPRR